MTIQERLASDATSARKEGDAPRLETLRLMRSELHNREIEKRSRGEDATLTDEDTVAVLRREVKKRKDAVLLFRKGGRNDLAEKEEKEIAVISRYLPAEMSRAEIEGVVRSVMGEGSKDFTGVMKEVMQRLRGRADGKVVSEVVKEKLG